MKILKSAACEKCFYLHNVPKGLQLLCKIWVMHFSLILLIVTIWHYKKWNNLNSPMLLEVSIK